MQTAIQLIKHELRNIYPDGEIQGIIRLIFYYLRGWSLTELVLKYSEKLTVGENELINGFIERLKRNEPIQYVLGETTFMRLRILVNPSVLIPRPETEELVNWISEENKSQSSILDVGTGSGCIALALKMKFPGADILGCDISEAALETARKNAEINRVKVCFFQADILRWEENQEFQKLDVIVSNPPYVTEIEKEKMPANVLAYEPSLALFVPNANPLLFYHKIGAFALKYLNPGGSLYFEINENFGAELKQLLENLGFQNVEIKTDLQGKPRMSKADKFIT